MDATLFLNGKPWYVTGSVIEKYSPNVAMFIQCDRNAVHVHIDSPAQLRRLGEEIIKLAEALQRDLNPPPLPTYDEVKDDCPRCGERVRENHKFCAACEAFDVAACPALSVIDEAS